MVPIPYDRSTGGVVGVGCVCPHCGKEINMTATTMTCQDCGYVPKHGAD